MIGADRRLVRQSIPSPHLPFYPSAWGYARRGRRTRIEEALVNDGFHSTNLSHHLIERLSGLELFSTRSGLAGDLPLIVNRRIFDSKFFAYLRGQSGWFAGLDR